MADIGTTTPRRGKGPLVPLPLLAFLGLVGLLAAGVWFLFLRGPDTDPAEQGPTPEAKAYIDNLKFTNVRMQAAESFAGHRVVEMLGEIRNAGNRPLETVEINCVFYNFNNEAILRQRATLVGRRGPLEPGETHEFRLAFDNIPPGWNQVLPQLVIAHMEFGG